MELNVLGKPLLLCCKNPVTGFLGMVIAELIPKITERTQFAQ